MGLAVEWNNLNATGLPPNVIKTIQSARAASTRSLYGCKWSVFVRWCVTTHEIPYQYSISTILSFLQDLIDRGRAFSTIKVFLGRDLCMPRRHWGQISGATPTSCSIHERSAQEPTGLKAASSIVRPVHGAGGDFGCSF